MRNILSLNLWEIRHSGNRAAISLEQFDLLFHPQHLFAKLNEAAASTDYKARHSTAYVLGAVCAPAPKEPVEQVPDHPAPRAIMDRLSAGARVITSSGGTGRFETCLQVFEDDQWKTVAMYGYRDGRGHRALCYANGDQCPVFMDLPAHVMLEMAREDFARHWPIYYREYLGCPARSAFPR